MEMGDFLGCINLINLCLLKGLMIIHNMDRHKDIILDLVEVIVEDLLVMEGELKDTQDLEDINSNLLSLMAILTSHPNLMEVIINNITYLLKTNTNPHLDH